MRVCVCVCVCVWCARTSDESERGSAVMMV